MSPEPPAEPHSTAAQQAGADTQASARSGADTTPASNTAALQSSILPPHIPDHQLLRRIGSGSYGEVWLARNALGTYRAVKIVHRKNFDHDHPFEREFRGI